MTLKYYTKQVYGKTVIYLADDLDAHNWHMLSGRKTITSSDMTNLTALTGVQFERVFEPEA